MDRLPADAVEYYRDPDVQFAMREYCGAAGGRNPTAVYAAGLEPDDRPFPTWSTHARTVGPEGLDTLWERGMDISRSLWDREHLLFLIELDYQNIDEPGEPFLRPAEVFFKLEATYAAARRVFRQLSMNPLTIVTGRGYQFIGTVPLDEPVINGLAVLTDGVPAWLAGVQNRLPPGVQASMSARHARAAEGLGKLIEFAAHLITREASHSSIPVVFNGNVVGAGLVGRECISIDFSHVGDPMDVRYSRVAFSTYQWHRQRPDIFGHRAAAQPVVATIPRERRPLLALLSEGRDLAAGRRGARSRKAALPDVRVGVRRLLSRYKASSLAAFHRTFDESAPVKPLPTFDPSRVAPCIALPFAVPNDLLLKPEFLQHVVRGLMAARWRPRDIAALIEKKYEEDHSWGTRWTRAHPGMRASFEVRSWAGAIHSGLDSLVDFNCVSAQEKGVCPGVGCPHDLRADREVLAAGR